MKSSGGLGSFSFSSGFFPSSHDTQETLGRPRPGPTLVPQASRHYTGLRHAEDSAEVTMGAQMELVPSPAQLGPKETF